MSQIVEYVPVVNPEGMIQRVLSIINSNFVETAAILVENRLIENKGIAMEKFRKRPYV